MAAAVGGVLLVGVPIAAAVALRPGNGSSPVAVVTRPGTGSSPARVITPARPTPSVPTVDPGFPAPPLGAVVFSRQAGPDALALGIVPRLGSVLLQASLVGQQGVGVSGRTVSFAVDGASKAATPCGPGCYRAVLPAHRPQVVTVTLDRPATRWRIALPQPWPPPNAKALMDLAGKTWRGLRSVSFHESLGSGSSVVVRSAWQIQAPDRLAYQVAGGWSAVVVGHRRWDRAPGSTTWVESAQTPLSQPVPTWTAVTNAYELGIVKVGGRPAWRVSFFDPGTPAWFTVDVARWTFRTLDVRMITTAHFMHDVYGAFNRTPPVEPPR